MPTLPELLLVDLHDQLQSLYGERLVRLVLYGSYARGDTHAESDVDVLVVLRGVVDSVAEIRQMSEIRMDLSLRYERRVSTLPIAAKAYAQ